MPNQGSTHDGPLRIRGGGLVSEGSLRISGGGLVLHDINTGPRRSEERMAAVSLTATQILALFAAPITIVPAPGADKFLEFVSAVIVKPVNTVAYDGVAAGEDLAIKYTDAAGVTVSTTLEATGFIDQTTAQIRTFKAITTDVTPAVNAALVLHLLIGEIATGNGTLTIQVIYRIRETGL